MDNFRDFDKLKVGDLVTSLYIECIRKDGVIIIERNGIGKEYSLKPRPDLTSVSANVKKIDIDDSEVFELVELFEYQILKNQTNKEQYTKILDSWGDTLGSTMIDELMVAEKSRLAGGVFNGTTPDTNFYTTTLVANGTANITNSVLDLATTTDSGSSAFVYTNSKGRYYGGNMNQLRVVCRVGDTGKTNNIRMIGITEDSTFDNSVYIQLSGTTFSVVAKTKGLADIKIDNGSLNGENANYNVTDNFITWEFLYTNKRIDIYANGTLIHSFIETATPICGTRHFRAFAKNTNTGVGSVTHAYVQVMTVITWGKSNSQPKSKLIEGLNVGTLLKAGIGSLHVMNLSGVTNTANITLYDGLDTNGTKIYTTGAMGPQTAPLQVPFNDGINFENGLYLTITGAACNAQVIYE